VALAVGVAAQSSFADETEIKVGTLAPKSSPWGKVFQIWQDSVSDQSNGNLKITFFWNGSQGDEGAMVEKMKTGNQLDAVACTAVGLSKIWRPILALQAPGLFRSWGALDKARDGMKADIDKNFLSAGFVNLGNGDIGLAHLMSKGFAIHTPDDLKGKSPYMWSDDVVAPVLFRTIGGVTPKPLSVPAVLPALNAGAVDVVNAPALAATQLQWASKLDNMVEDVSGAGIGALVMKKTSLDALPADQQKLILDTGAVAAKGLTDRIRKADANAFENLKKKMTTNKLTDDEAGKWNDVFKRTRESLKQGVFEPAMLSGLEGQAG
jgi:TRAP-type C4-dicarboxylate transport system substrate-binding protein